MNHVALIVFAVFVAFVGVGWILIRWWRERSVLNTLQQTLDVVHRMDPNRLEAVGKAFETVHKRSLILAQWRLYDDRLTNRKPDELVRIDPFLGLDVLMDRLDRGILVDAGVIVSVGVFCTFVGFVQGLGGVGRTDVESMRTGIGVLLSGMQNAFSTSIIGIFGAAVWTIIHRWMLLTLEKRVQWLSSKLVNLLNPDEEEIFLQRLERLAEHQASHLKTVLADALEAALQPSLQQFERQTALLEEQVRLGEQQSERIADRLVEGVTGGAAQRIADLQSVIERTNQMQERMQATLEATASRLETAGVSWTHAADQVRATVGALQRLAEDVLAVQRMLTELTSTVQELHGTAVNLIEAQGRLLPDLKQTLDEHGTRLSQATRGLTELAGVVQGQVSELTSHWAAAETQFTQTREALDNSLRDFAARVEEGLSKTYQHFDSTLVGAVNHLFGAVNEIRMIHEELTDAVQELANALQAQSSGTPVVTAEQ